MTSTVGKEKGKQRLVQTHVTLRKGVRRNASTKKYLKFKTSKAQRLKGSKAKAPPCICVRVGLTQSSIPSHQPPPASLKYYYLHNLEESILLVYGSCV